jgi:organic radical activating enzyme
VDQIRYIEFTGGEPFMIDQHFDLLQGIVDRGCAGQVEIHYNTNGTQWPERGPDIWRHFRTVEIAFSIDDVGERFEYQRTNARWSEVCRNLARFRELRASSPNIQIQCCSTVNVYNVLYLEELADWIDAQAFDFVYWNMLHEAQHLSVAAMPPAAKHLAQERLAAAQVSDRHRGEFARICDFMQQGTSQNSDYLVQQIQRLDQRRGSRLADNHHELAQVIGYA